MAGILAVPLAGSALKTGSLGDPPQGAIRKGLSKLPLYFLKNRGQIASTAIDYYVHGVETSVGFSSEGVVLSLPDTDDPDRRWTLGLEFVGAAPVAPVGRGRTGATFSYFKGDSDQWVTGLPGFARVAYRDVWPGIDLVYSGTGSELKYSFLVEPGADPSKIRLAYRGATNLTVNEQGQLRARTPAGTITDDTPFSYQGSGERRTIVPSSYDVDGRSYGFEVGSYDPTLPLVIDPAVLVYAGYIGGSGSESGNGIAVDGAGAAYVTGIAHSTEATFPDGDGFGALTGPDPTFNGTNDAYVVKVSPSGTSLVYAGYIGGNAADEGLSVAVDGVGAAYVTGNTASASSTFPDGDGFGTLNGPDTTANGSTDAFVAKLTPSGTSLVYAGYIGGSLFDRGDSIAVDAAGAAYVAGSTFSTETTFPDGDGFGSITGPDTTHNGGIDGWVAKINSSAQLVYAGYIGGAGTDNVRDIAVDASGAAHVAGETESTETTFPDGDGFDSITGPDTTHNGGGFDAFVAQVVPAGGSLSYAGYIGGSGEDLGFGIAVDGSGAAYVTGTTLSTEATFPNGDGIGALPGPDTTYNGGVDAFLAKVTSGGASLSYAGYIGGLDDETSTFSPSGDIGVDGSGAAYVTGTTRSTEATFPDGDGFGTVGGPDTTHNGDEDSFVAKVVPAGTSLSYAGYIGGSGLDIGSGIAVDGSGAAYVVGLTTSDNVTFPDGDGIGTLTGPDTTSNGGIDAFVAKVAIPQPKSVTLKAKPRRVTVGERTKLIAVVSPCLGHEGDLVEFYRGSRKISTRASDATCTARMKVRMNKTAKFKAVSPQQDADHLAGTSTTVKVRVLP